MIIEHQTVGVPVQPYRMKAVDGVPPVGAILRNANWPDDIQLKVVSVDWRYRFGFFGSKLEAYVKVIELASQEEKEEEDYELRG